MYCPKCKFTSFDHLATCSKCGYDWQQIRADLNLAWLQTSGFDWFSESRASSRDLPDLSIPSDPTDPSDPSQFPSRNEEDFNGSTTAEDLQIPTAPHVSTSGEADLDSQPELMPEDFSLDLSDNPDMREMESAVSLDHTQEFDENAVVEAPSLAVEPDSEAVFLDDAAGDLFLPEDGKDLLDEYSVDSSKTPRTALENVSEDLSEAELPVWEIELPEDLLPQDYYPQSPQEDATSQSPEKDHFADDLLPAGDIAYDLDGLEAISPKLEETPEDASAAQNGQPSGIEAGHVQESTSGSSGNGQKDRP